MKIVDFGYNGEGVAREGGKVCFVPYSLVGEEVSARVIKDKSSFCQCQLENVVTPSPKRKVPPCPYFSKCGGCDFQHMSYADELNLKKEIAKRQLAKIGYGGEIEIKFGKEYGYRNKIKLFCSHGGLGLKHAQSAVIENIEKCLLIDEKMNFALKKCDFFIKSNKIQEIVKNVVIKKFGSQYAVKFELGKDAGLDYIGLSLVLGEDFSLFQSVGKGETKLMQGKEIALYEYGLHTKPSVDAFRQVNDEVAQMLYRDVLSYADGTVVNAYSGAGVLSARLAAKCKKVYGIELGSVEHESAEVLKNENDILNLINIHGDCADEMGKSERVDCVIVDPPRAGCDERVTGALNMCGAKTILYVSCNIASLVRDIARLDDYVLESVTIYDMFPRTANFENLAILRKKQ